MLIQKKGGRTRRGTGAGGACVRFATTSQLYENIFLYLSVLCPVLVFFFFSSLWPVAVS